MNSNRLIKPEEDVRENFDMTKDLNNIKNKNNNYIRIIFIIIIIIVIIWIGYRIYKKNIPDTDLNIQTNDGLGANSNITKTIQKIFKNQ